jgi:hypothetical protein
VEQGAPSAEAFSTPAVLESVQLPSTFPMAAVHPLLKTIPKPFQLQVCVPAPRVIAAMLARTLTQPHTHPAASV